MLKILFVKIKDGFVAHRLIIIIALFLSVLVSFSPTFFPLLAKNIYRGINIAHFGTDEEYYLARGKEIIEGHSLGNIVLREGKEKQEPHFTYVEHIMLAPIKILGLGDKINIVTVYNFYNFIGVFTLILLIYFFTRQLVTDKRLATASALFVVGGYSIIYNKVIGSPEVNIYGRAIFPQLSSIFFFLFLLFLVKAIKSTRRDYTIWAGILLGFLFYVFFYVWTFVLALMGTLFIVYLFKKDRRLVKKIIAVAVIGLIIGAFNLIGLFLFYTSPAGEQLSYFLYAYNSHIFVFSKIGLMTLSFFGLLIYKKRKDENLILIFSLIITGWIALNQQIITGKILQYGQYYWFFVVPVSIVVSFYIFWQLFLKKEIYKNIFLAAIIAVVFLNTFIGQYKSFQLDLPGKIAEQNYRPFINYLVQDVKPGVILGADSSSELLFIIYTKHDLFWSSTALVYNTPINRAEDALYVYLYLNKESRNDFAGYLGRVLQDKNTDSFYKSLYRSIEAYGSGFYWYNYADRESKNDPVILEQRKKLLADLDKKYQRIADNKGAGVIDILAKYGVDYIIWDKNRNSEWDLSVIPNTSEVFSENNIYLYKFSVFTK